MDKHEFQQWPHVTRFRIWKTEEVMTGTTHPQQATDWLAERPRENQWQDLEDVGFVFGSTRTRFEAPKGVMKIIIFCFQKKSSGDRSTAIISR